MSFLASVRKLGVFLIAAVAAPAALFAQTNFLSQGGEYLISGSLPGDQVFPQVSLNAGGGFLVWQDNVADGSGLGIGAMRLDATFSGSLMPFRVNQTAAGDQEHPQVSLLNGGGAAFVWQGGRQGFEHIYARFLSSSNTWLTGDVMANSSPGYFQTGPVIATLAGGNVVTAWSSLNQAGAASRLDVYAQLFSPAGQKINGEFQVNQFTDNNQRSPAVAPLAGGGFVMVWVSEQQRNSASGTTNFFSLDTASPDPSIPAWSTPSVDVYARLYNANGTPAGNEFLVNTGSNVCAAPTVVGLSDGSFAIAWMEKDVAVPNNSWDVFARSFNALGTGGTVTRVNTQLYGDQYSPKISAVGGEFLVVWTSLSQDGSREGVFGQFLNSDASPSGGEFLVNTTTAGPQMQQAIGSDGASRFLVVWTSFASLGSGFDLFAQRYSDPSQPFIFAPAPPTVTTLSSNALQVSWAKVGGLNVAGYEIYADGAVVPDATVVLPPTSNSWTMDGLTIGTTHTFQLAYILGDSTRSPLSLPASGTTYDTTTNLANNGGNTGGNGGGYGGDGGGNTGDTILKLPFPGHGHSSAGPLTFADVKGVYNGLFYNSDTVANESSGYISITTTTSGGFSGKLQMGKQVYSFSGQFNASGGWTNLVARKGLPPVKVALQLDLQGNDQITGQVSTLSWSAALWANRAVFNKSKPTPLAGKYTVVFPGDSTATTSPAGDGVGTLTVDASGNVQWSGFLGDGSVAGEKTTLSKDNLWPLYVPLYNGGGFIIGWMQFEDTVEDDMSGPFIWSKSAAPGAPYYPGGFVNNNIASGSTYAPPPVGFDVFGDSDLALTGGSLASPLNTPVFWNTANKVLSVGGSPGFSFTLTPATGLFKGTVTDPGTGQKYIFQGVLFEKRDAGLGYSLGAGQSSQLYFAPTP